MFQSFRYVLPLLMFGVTTTGLGAQYLGKTTSQCGSCSIPDNSCNSRPQPASPCSATNVGTEQAWPTGSVVNVVIDDDPADGFSAAEVTAIETAFTNWQNSVGGAVKFNFTTTSGLPEEPPYGNDWEIERGTVPANLSANTTWTSTNGNINYADTAIDPNIQLTTGPTGTLENLMEHEIAHPMGLGDENEAACKGVSVTYQQGSTLSAPSSCDKTASKTITCAGGTAKCSAPSNGGGGGGESPEGCTTSQPNETCQCENAVWECECPGIAPTCSDDTMAICYEGGWTCGSVTTSCDPTGTPPYIPPDTGAEYVWDSSSCSWVLEPCSEAGCQSPIIIDTDGSGFHLTSAKDGVLFDFFGTGSPVQIAWTAKGSTNG